MEKDIINKIQDNYQKLSKSQKLIAEYILNHYDKAAFLTAAKLGSTVNVSESTVVRFANVLGYEGYPELQKALQELIKNKLTTVQRLELADDYHNGENIVKAVLKSDMEDIRDTMNELNFNDFEEVIDMIYSAKKIYIIGLRSSTALAEYLGFYLNLILDNVIVIKLGISDIFEQIIKISVEDVIIGIGFPRYSKKTIDALMYAKEKKAKIIAITDSLISPLAPLSDKILIAKSDMDSFVDSLVAPMSLINALIVALGLREKEKITTTFKNLENLWQKYEVYANKP
ncbi:MurR/RpiR family transcriptional regulator [Calorimonas adulescens]|uniref:MurR/RpiR family transcriptional regulator n=1 Tax=Calorimonas adulescens TaxID=2606906 RepID=A0A5D8Q8H5_9THEO|nr:MurR/RpiR family transcriptional regulator [Calorimonas adulescens]TZE80811.1 MurR/RpiR family transcriptional regulator [Calorimonas adulescens]